MKKIKVAIIFIILTNLLFIGCTSEKSSKEPPKITITIGDKEIKYIIAKNQWDGAKHDREDTFKTILKKDSDTDIPHIEIGKTAMISFNNHPPTKFTVLDILIDKNGNQMYSNMEITNIQVELKKGKCSFEIKKHPASFLSSKHEKNKIDIRGFRIIASWGENECEYAFIIRTDGA